MRMTEIARTETSIDPDTCDLELIEDLPAASIEGLSSDGEHLWRIYHPILAGGGSTALLIEQLDPSTGEPLPGQWAGILPARGAVDFEVVRLMQPPPAIPGLSRPGMLLLVALLGCTGVLRLGR